MQFSKLIHVKRINEALIEQILRLDLVHNSSEKDCTRIRISILDPLFMHTNKKL